MTNLRRSLVLSFASFCLFAVAGCSGSSSDYKNSLTFGTGLGGNGFDLVGENTTFSIAMLGTGSQLYFRLESADDQAGRAVRLYFNDLTNKDFIPPQSYGHILLSAFTITNVGSYTVKGYLVEQVGPDIGKETFVAQSDLTMTP
jgi:hypothetical protein